MRNYSISAIIPVGPKESRVALCLENLLRLSPPVDEVLIIADGTNELAQAAAKKFGVSYVESKYSKGPANARNQGAFVAPAGNMTLISTSTTAESTPTKGDIVMTYVDYAGTATVNTDIKAYCSRDNGTTYTQMTLASQGTTGGHTILSAHDVDISSQPSGTAMRYKIETLNQSATKATRIHAVSLGWS